mgnify:CR=1 FL=1
MIDITGLREDKRPQSSTIVHALLDRLEAAEADALEQARLNGMGSEREAALMVKLEAAEKDIALKERIIDSLGSTLNAVANERDALLARIEEMERQKPVAWMLNCQTLGGDTGWMLSWTQSGAGMCNRLSGEENERKLYALPGAQPAPSVPEDVMRDAERYRYLRARDDETAGIGCWIEAEGRACDRGWLYGVQLDSAIDTCIEMLAAAPEAKP